MVTVNGKQGEAYYTKPVEFHECSEAELGDFASPKLETETELESIIKSDKRTLFCLDWEDDEKDFLSVWGSYSSYDNQFITVMLVPCNFVPPGLEASYPVSQDCIWDEKA